MMNTSLFGSLSRALHKAAPLVVALGLSACESSDKIFGTDLADTTTNVVSSNDAGSSLLNGFDGCVSGVALDTTSIRVTFQFPTTATKISLYRDGILIAAFTNPLVTTFTDYGLQQGRSYLYTCEGTFDGLTRRGTRDLTLSTLLTDPPTFAGITSAQAVDAHSVLLKWKSATGVPVDHYRVFKKLGSSLDMDAEVPLQSLPLGTTQVTVTGLGDELVYSFGVRACAAPAAASDSLCEANTETRAATTPDGGAPQTSGASIAVANNGQVTLTLPWSDQNGAVKKRKIYRNTTGGTSLAAYTLIQTVDVALTSANFTNPPTSIVASGTVTEGTTYYYIVQDEDSAASNNNTNFVSVYIGDQTPPVFGGILTLTNGTQAGAQKDSVLTANFSAIASQPAVQSGASAYLVYKTEADFPDAPSDPCTSSGQLATQLTATSYSAANTVNVEINGLTPRKNYRICIKARDEAGNISNNINYLTATTWDMTAPTFDGIQSLTYSGGQIVAAWNPATPANDAKEYRIKAWKNTSSPLPGQITTVTKTSPTFDSGFSFASPFEGFSFTDSDSVYVLVDVCDNATVYGGPQNCTSIATNLAKNITIPDTSAPTIGSVVKMGSGSLWNLSWSISDNITPSDQLFVKVRRKVAATDSDFPDLAVVPFTQGAGLTSVSSESGPAETEGFINYLFEVIEAGTNLTGTATYSVAYDNKAPSAATALGWTEASPVSTMPATASWTKSVSTDVATQKIQFFSSSACSSGGSSIQNLGINDQTKSFSAPGEGTYAYQIITTDSAGNTSTSPCSATMRYDWTAPTVQSVGSPTANGAYTVDQSITISVNFTEAVAVTGTPRIQLNIGGPIAYANYVNGSGSSTLNFVYTVAEGHNSSDLDCTATNALTLNGGTIKDLAANVATLMLPSPGAAGSLGANKDISVDTNLPSITISSPANNTTINATQNVNNYALNGTCSENGNAVTVEIDGFPTGASVTCTAGEWSTTLDATAWSHAPTGTAHTIRVSITKTVNTTTAQAQVTVVKDITPPSISDIVLTDPAESPGTDSTPTIRVQGTSNEDAVELFAAPSVDDCVLLNRKATGTATGATTDLTTIALTDGSYTFRAKATDKAGNASACSSLSVSYLLDRVGPEAASSLGWVQSSPYGQTSITAQWTKSASADLANQKIQFYADGGCGTPSGALIDLVSSSTTTRAFTAPADGSYTYNVTSIDAAGNLTVSDCSSPIVIDSLPPAITIATPINGGYANSTNYVSYTVSGTCEAGSSNVTLTATGSTTVDTTVACPTGIFSTTMNLTPLADGEVSFSAAQADSAGNPATSASVAITKDIVVPTAAVGSPSTTFIGASGSVSFTVTYSGSNTRNLTSAGVTLNTSGANCGTKTITNGTTASPTVTLTSCTGSGTIGITIDAGTATDLAGNPSSVSAPSATLTVDAAGPTTPGSLSYTPSGSMAGWFNSTGITPVFNWNASTDASGVNRYEIAIGTSAGGTNIISWESTGTGTTRQFSGLSLSSGTTYHVSVRAFDNLGNVSSSAQTSWTVDITPPAAPGSVNDGTSNMSQDQSPPISWTASSDTGSGVDHYEIALGTSTGVTDLKDWTSIGNVTSTTVSGLTLTASSYYFAGVRAVDRAGNIGSATWGNGWQSVQNPCAGATLGQACTGGALYAGQFDGGSYMVTPSGCTNSATPTCAGGGDTLTKAWYGTSGSDVDIPGVTNVTSAATPSSSSQRGHITTPIIVAHSSVASDSAADYCNDMVYGGYDDWYLPSKSELAYLYCHSSSGGTHNTSYPYENPNCTNYGGRTYQLTGFSQSAYWSSTEYDYRFPWRQFFGNGSQSNSMGKNYNGYLVRCVRRYE